MFIAKRQDGGLDLDGPGCLVTIAPAEVAFPGFKTTARWCLFTRDADGNLADLAEADDLRTLYDVGRAWARDTRQAVR